MKPIKSTPRDLLRKHRDVYGGPLFKPCRTPAEMDFYVKATAICQECDHRFDVLIGYDETVYHECNQGNRVTQVPRTVKGNS